MARKLTEIYDSIIAEKNTMSSLTDLQPAIDNSQNLLADLSSTSKVAIWRLWAFLTATAIWAHENLWDLFKAEIQAIVDAAVPGTSPWYRDQALAFQYGDSLIYLNNKFQYFLIDPTKQIVTRAAIADRGGQIIIKVAKGTTTPIKLDDTPGTELDAFKSYIQDIKFAGTNIAIISRDADLLKISYDVYYDPLITKAVVQVNVEAAINAYIGNLPFDGYLILTKLTDAIQAAVGVVNPVITDAQAKYGLLPYSPIVVKYNANAGYLSIDPAFPLATQINYIANV